VAVIPFGSSLGGQKMVIADLDVGILYTFGIVSLGVYGIVLAVMRRIPSIRFSEAFVQRSDDSYEISMGLSVIPVFMIVGNLNLSSVIVTRRPWLADLQTTARLRDFPGRGVCGNESSSI